MVCVCILLRELPKAQPKVVTEMPGIDLPPLVYRHSTYPLHHGGFKYMLITGVLQVNNVKTRKWYSTQ